MSDVQPEDAGDATESSGPVTLRVSGLPYNDTFTCGEGDEVITVTRDGTDVPADKVEAVMTAAQAAGMPLEVVTE